MGRKDLPNGSVGVAAVYEVNGGGYILRTVSGGNPFPAGANLRLGGVNPLEISKSYKAFAWPEAKKP